VLLHRKGLDKLQRDFLFVFDASDKKDILGFEDLVDGMEVLATKKV